MFAPGPDEKPFTWVYEPRQISVRRQDLLRLDWKIY